MIIRILIAGFASSVAGLSYLTGMARIMTALLLGFGAFISFVFGILFLFPADGGRLWFPVSGEAPAYPFFIIGTLLAAMIFALYLAKPKFEIAEQVSRTHFKYFIWGSGGYLSTLFISSFFWFPSDSRKLAIDESGMVIQALAGTCFFIFGVSCSLYLLYRASRGSSAERPDMMRRFVLALFAFFQLDKVPAFVAYLLIYSPDVQLIFPNLAALALSAYIPVGIFLLKTNWDIKEG